MSAPLASVFHGDITIEIGSDTGLYGFGKLDVANNITISGTTDGASGSGALSIPNGGIYTSSSAYINGKMTVMSTSNLQTTRIDTTLGTFTVSGGNSATISTGSAVLISSNTGTASIISATNNVIVNGGTNSANAVQIIATNAAGGVNILSGQTGLIELTTGSGGLQGLTSAGNITLTANNNNATFQVNSNGANQNVSIAQNGAFDSGITITSNGTNITNKAINIITINTGGSVFISNNTAGSGGIYNNTGTSGYDVTTSTGGPINLTANYANSKFIVNSSGGSGQNLTVAVQGSALSSGQLILQSNGTNNSQAILIQTTNTAGGILLSQPNSLGAIILNSGSGGIYGTTAVGGGIKLNSYGISEFINYTANNSENLTIGVSGTTGSSLILSSQGTGTNAIQLNANGGNTSGITATANGPISIQSSSASLGINIGTLGGGNIPVNIGSSNSTTTILGDLSVEGTVTTYQTEVVQIGTNFIEVNNAPLPGADAGLSVGRFQEAANTGTASGNVVNDTPEISGTAQAGSASPASITLAAGDIAVDNYYNGYWIRLTGGTGSGQVRRIKSYVSASKIATIYNTADQTGVLDNPSPVEGLNWLTTPDVTSTYSLYPCKWIVSMWDEILQSWILGCSNYVTPGNTIPVAEYINLICNDITANNITATTINGAAADTIVTLNLPNNASTAVNITTPFNYGVYILLVKPTTVTNTCYAIFVIGRSNYVSTGQVVRLISIKGDRIPAGEQLDVQWPSAAFPQLFFRTHPNIAGTTNFTIRVMSV